MGINARRERERQQIDGSQPQPKKPKNKPKKPFSQMTGAEYMRHMDKVGKGFI